MTILAIAVILLAINNLLIVYRLARVERLAEMCYAVLDGSFKAYRTKQKEKDRHDGGFGNPAV